LGKSEGSWEKIGWRWKDEKTGSGEGLQEGKTEEPKRGMKPRKGGEPNEKRKKD